MSRLPRKTEKFSANVKGANQQAARARRVSSTISDSMMQSLRDVSADAELIYQAHAPRRSGRLARGIRAVPVGVDQVTVSAVAVDPKSGFDYVAVTRFGHRKRIIVPVSRGGSRRKSRAVVRTATGQFAKRSGGRLVFTSRGRLWRLSSVRGFRPKSDWVEDAFPEIAEIAKTEMQKTANKITTAWGA